MHKAGPLINIFSVQLRCIFADSKMSNTRHLLPRENRDDPEVDEGDHDEEEELVLVKTIGVVGKWQLEKALILASYIIFILPEYSIIYNLNKFRPYFKL